MTLPGVRVLAALACVGVLLAGCGDETTDAADDPTGAASVSDTTDGDPSSSASDSPSSEAPSTTPPTDEPKTEPACETVWVDGKNFKAGYKGCFNGERWVKARPVFCSFGGKLFTYDGHFWATPNKPVHHARDGLAKDPDYRQVLGACTA